MLKITKRGSMGSHGFDEMEEKLRSKHLRAQRYYDELLMETLVKKKIVHRVKKKKCTLEAEVRFLRQRYEYLMSIQSPSPPQKQDPSLSQVQQTHKQALPPVQRIYRNMEALPIERIYRNRDAPTVSSDREAALPSPAPIIDLNQVSTEEEEFATHNLVEPTRVGDLMKLQNRRGKPPLPPKRSNLQLCSDAKFSVCRDIQTGSSQRGKRKISWQDPVALKV